MSTSFEKFNKRKLLSSYFSVVIIIALVLFLVGILALLLLNTKVITNHFKEHMAINVFLKDGVRSAEISHLQKVLLIKKYTKASKFISKDEAAKTLSKEIGENFIEFLGKNPLHNSIDIYLKADYVNQQKMNDITKEILDLPQVLEVNYDKPLVFLLNENTKKLSVWILIITILFSFIAILVINSSIRLSIYSQRFIIKTMQMVGASKAFILKPFIWRNIRLGFIGALIAIGIIAFGSYKLNYYIPELHIMNTRILTQVFVSIILVGVLITGISTFLATQKFLNLKTDEVYY